MGQVVTIGLDIAKSVFQVHGVDSDGDPSLFEDFPTTVFTRSGNE
ncbi:MAG TPA: hypothetical protein VFE10_13740 [Phenylobacterium sp.]|jgi:transposase|nr:hypothetical protein [Phenylobacterium sp.]